ncbi:MAG: hypothetical protein U1F30_15035 [Steroidobacteraceae bacterium]
MLVDQNPYVPASAFGILNLNVGWKAADDKLSATLFCNNVLDKHYFTDLEDFERSLGWHEHDRRLAGAWIPTATSSACG